MNKFFVFFFIFVLIMGPQSSKAVGKSAPPKKPDYLVKVGAKYRSAKQVSMDLQKTVISSLLGKEKVYEGKVDIGGPLFRLENIKPDQSLIVFDGKNLWSVQFAPGGGSQQVARAKVDKKNQSQILVATLLSNKPIQDQVSVESSSVTDELVRYQTQPKNASWGIQDLNFTINRKTLVVTEIEYKDDLGNETKMVFSNVKFQKKIEKSVFKYSPPKGAQVIDL